MIKTETRQVVAVYCDVCGQECMSNYTTFHQAGGDKHACSVWDDAKQSRCDHEFPKQNPGASSKAKPAKPPTPKQIKQDVG